MFLEAHFGEVEFHMPDSEEKAADEEPEEEQEPTFLVRLDEANAVIYLLSMVSLDDILPSHRIQLTGSNKYSE